ncbi:GntR family transcriptional regulator [Bradyrhizobium sp.]|uniref:GntR family transcriptional regulator n=1 Tax=Bradyrhizobium sp. TaxID=376 RepID=UPI000A9C843F|nr:GntR family transcriptional regulator [Bradyrhizobium sp.]
MPEADCTSDESQSERAYRELRDLIVDNRLGAGAQLLELEAAERLGMSRTPVREAMLRLQQEGMVEIRPRHGMRVLPVSADDMREIYEVLTALESTAAYLVAERGLSREKLARLSDAVAAMDDALDADNLVKWSEADERFHFLLVQFSDNARLAQMVGQLWDQAHRVRLLTLKLRPKPIKSNRDHEALVNAIRKRDAGLARQIHHDHRSKAGKMLIALLTSLGLRQL